MICRKCDFKKYIHPDTKIGAIFTLFILPLDTAKIRCYAEQWEHKRKAKRGNDRVYSRPFPGSFRGWGSITRGNV